MGKNLWAWYSNDLNIEDCFHLHKTFPSYKLALDDALRIFLPKKRYNVRITLQKIKIKNAKINLSVDKIIYILNENNNDTFDDSHEMFEIKNNKKHKKDAQLALNLIIKQWLDRYVQYTHMVEPVETNDTNDRQVFVSNGKVIPYEEYAELYGEDA